MPYFLQITRHAPADCPVHNEKTRRKVLELSANLDAECKRYRIKLVGAWSSYLDHTTYIVWEAPDINTIECFGMGSGWPALASSEAKHMVDLKEAVERIKKLGKIGRRLVPVPLP